MPFSFDVKAELISVNNTMKCCEIAETYGLLLFGHAFGKDEVSLHTENSDAAAFYSSALRSLLAGARVDISQKSGVTYVRLSRASYCKTVYDFFREMDTVAGINRSFLRKDCCVGAFLRGAFISGGLISDPRSQYRLEFSAPDCGTAEALKDILSERGIKPAVIKRGGRYSVYLTERGKIEDTLTVMGATNCSLELMQEAVRKSLRNKVNRAVNCDTANLERTRGAVERQLHAISVIERHEGLNSLPKELLEVALLRRSNPEEPLSELGAMLDPPLSRSGVNHRLDKIKEIAAKIESQEKKSGS